MKVTNTEHTVINGNHSKCRMTQFNLGGALTKSGVLKKAEGRQKICANPLLSFHYYPDGTLLHQDLAAFAILGKNDVHSSLK